MKRVAIDVDTGVDDALALLLALRSPELSLEAVTTVAGNVPVETATRNTRLVLDVAQAPRALPLAQGAPRPLRRDIVHSTFVHGEDGLGNASGVYPPPQHLLAETDAATLLLELIERHGEELTLISLGPMTNLALAARLDAALFRRVGEVVQMGGAVRHPGNITPMAEFNIYVDPEAAAEVVATGVPLRLVPLDATTGALLTRAELRRLAQERDSAAFQFVREITVVILDFYQQRLGLDGFHPHDPMATAAAIDPGLLTWERIRLEVRTDDAERGRTVGSPDQNSPVLVATGVDAGRFLPFLTDRVCR
jgi:inosine-uridine nucleoside N-ribohydrolase